MVLEGRVRKLESTVRPAPIASEHQFGFDQLLAKLGLEPTAVRELARNRGSSPAEVTAELCGMEFREFKRTIMRGSTLGGGLP